MHKRLGLLAFFFFSSTAKALGNESAPRGEEMGQPGDFPTFVVSEIPSDNPTAFGDPMEEKQKERLATASRLSHVILKQRRRRRRQRQSGEQGLRHGNIRILEIQKDSVTN